MSWERRKGPPHSQPHQTQGELQDEAGAGEDTQSATQRVNHNSEEYLSKLGKIKTNVLISQLGKLEKEHRKSEKKRKTKRKSEKSQQNKPRARSRKIKKA